MISTSCFDAPGGPHCTIKQQAGEQVGRCLDFAGEEMRSGGQIRVYPCHNKWHQMFGFENGRTSPVGTIFNSIPTHLVNKRKNEGFIKKVEVSWIQCGMMREINHGPSIYQRKNNLLMETIALKKTIETKVRNKMKDMEKLSKEYENELFCAIDESD